MVFVVTNYVLVSSSSDMLPWCVRWMPKESYYQYW